MLGPGALLSVWERGRPAGDLHRAVLLLAAFADIAVAEAAGWDVGSRDVVLSRALAMLDGSPAWGAVTCDGCAAELDVPVDVAAVASWPVVPPGTTHTHGDLSFRLPTSADLAAVARLAAGDARDELLERCGGAEATMAQLAPAAALTIAVTCPDCAALTEAGFDPGRLLWAAVAARAGALLRDVHTLATAYGWTEPEVLALCDERRAAYLEMVA